VTDGGFPATGARGDRVAPMPDPRERHLIRYAGGFAPLTVARAEGAWIETTDGRRILDFTSGQICSTLGHNHPRIADAIRASLDEVVHLNSWMLSEPVLALGERLALLAPDPLARVMLLNTGSESNEVAVKLAKLATGRFELVGLTRSFHGLLAGTSSVTFSMGHAGYGPLVPGALALPAPYAYRCPIRHCDGACDCTCLEAGFDLVDQQSVGSLAAVVAEPVLSAGGIIVPPPGYLARLLELCRERGMLLVMDEAQTGFGRLGAMFGFELDGIVPDFVAVSKTLGGGVPLAATITTAAIEETAVERGFLHITSHVSDPLPAAAGLAVLDVIEEEDLVGRARERGAYLDARLRDLQVEHEQIGEVRGRGLLAGLELVTDRDTREPANALGAAVTGECLRCGLSMNIVRSGENANCFRMAPPLSVTEDEIDLAVDILDSALRTCVAAGAAGGVPAAG
jgi:2,2-dialkylglycine decarboxylase (pyruvate)